MNEAVGDYSTVLKQDWNAGVLTTDTGSNVGVDVPKRIGHSLCFFLEFIRIDDAKP
ncbi:hypothetical protein D3C71_1744970 [compost metagenome]